MDFDFALRHYFFPGHSNNHKARLLHSTSILFFALFLIVYQVILRTFPLAGVKILGYAANIPPESIISLTNQKRAENEIPALSYNATLSQAARLKAEHMLQYDYWAHVAPDGTEPWKFFTDQGYRYRYAGENLARDFSNPQDAIDAWMASPSHKDNMLSSKYKEIGVGVAEGDLGGVDTTIIVQFFGTQLTDTTPQLAEAQAKPQVTVTPTLTPSVVLTPTTVPVFVQTSPMPTEGVLIPQEIPLQERASAFQVLISPFESTRGVAVGITSVLIAVLAVDGIIVAKRKIPRLSGRTLAHIAFLGMILAILLIAKAGKIL